MLSRCLILMKHCEIVKLCSHFFTFLAYRNNSLFVDLRWHAFRILLKLNSPSLLHYIKPSVVRVVNRIYYLSLLKLKFSLCPLYFLITWERWLFIEVLYLGIKSFVWHQWASYVVPDLRQQQITFKFGLGLVNMRFT